MAIHNVGLEHLLHQGSSYDIDHVSGVMIGGGGCILFMFMLPPLSWVWG